MSRLQVARPLPECAVCSTPTRRQAFDANGGMCSTCRDAYGNRRGCPCAALCTAWPACQEAGR